MKLMWHSKIKNKYVLVGGMIVVVIPYIIFVLIPTMISIRFSKED